MQHKYMNEMQVRREEHKKLVSKYYESRLEYDSKAKRIKDLNAKKKEIEARL